MSKDLKDADPKAKAAAEKARFKALYNELLEGVKLQKATERNEFLNKFVDRNGLKDIGEFQKFCRVIAGKRDFAATCLLLNCDLLYRPDVGMEYIRLLADNFPRLPNLSTLLPIKGRSYNQQFVDGMMHQALSHIPKADNLVRSNFCRIISCVMQLIRDKKFGEDFYKSVEKDMAHKPTSAENRMISWVCVEFVKAFQIENGVVVKGMGILEKSINADIDFCHASRLQLPELFVLKTALCYDKFRHVFLDPFYKIDPEFLATITSAANALPPGVARIVAQYASQPYKAAIDQFAETNGLSPLAKAIFTAALVASLQDRDSAAKYRTHKYEDLHPVMLRFIQDGCDMVRRAIAQHESKKVNEASLQFATENMLQALGIEAAKLSQDSKQEAAGTAEAVRGPADNAAASHESKRSKSNNVAPALDDDEEQNQKPKPTGQQPGKDPAPESGSKADPAADKSQGKQ